MIDYFILNKLWNFILFFRYGLLVPKKKLGGVKASNVFGNDSDSENESKNKPIQVFIHIYLFIKFYCHQTMFLILFNYYNIIKKNIFVFIIFYTCIVCNC